MKRIVIDAGHGGSDPGAIGFGVVEKELNLRVALKLYQLTKTRKDDYERILTRSTDDRLSNVAANDLKKRGLLGSKADLFLSLHCDSFSDKIASGFTILTNYNSPSSEKFAKILERHYKNQFTQIKSRGIKTKVNSSGNDDYYGVLRPIPHNIPAVIFEMGFISNMKDCQLLLDPLFSTKAASAILSAIDDFFLITKDKQKENSEIAGLEKILEEKRQIILAQTRLINELREKLASKK